MLQEIRVGSVRRGDSGVDDEAGEQSTSTRKLVVVFGLIILAVLLVPVVGLIPPLVALVAALTIGVERKPLVPSLILTVGAALVAWGLFVAVLRVRSEEHTSELQSRGHLVCSLLLAGKRSNKGC